MPRSWEEADYEPMLYNWRICAYAFRLYKAVKEVMVVRLMAEYHIPAGSAIKMVNPKRRSPALCQGKGLVSKAEDAEAAAGRDPNSCSFTASCSSPSSGRTGIFRICRPP